MYKKLSLISLTIVSAAGISASPLDRMHKDPWTYLGYKLFQVPKNESKKLGNRLKFWSPVGLSMLGAYKGIENNDFYFLKKDNMFHKSMATISSGALAAFVSNYFISKNLESNNFRKFIKNWHSNKEFTPTVMHKAFDETFELYQKDKDQFEEELQEIIALTKKRIFEELPENVKADFQKIYMESKSFNTHLNIDIGRIINALVNVFRAYNEHK